jgi:hypothetical protein
MQINFSDYDLSEFIIKEDLFCGIPAKLIIPNHIGTKFNKKNAIFRSSIWDLDGGLLSGSYKKFPNMFENPDNFPFYDDGEHIFVDKIDGSTGIFDWVNFQLSIRTRGVFSYISQSNSRDFEEALTPELIDWVKNNPDYSVLTEITSPRNVIVLNYGEKPEYWLTGIVNKNDYSLLSQSELDKIAQKINLRRPQYYKFDSITDAISNIKLWKNKEGVVCYNEKYGAMHKIKAEEYLARHRFKESANLESVFELFIQWNCPNKEEFKNKLVSNFDFECYQMVESFVPIVLDTYNLAQKYFHSINNFILPYYLNNSSRKEAALAIVAKYRDLGLTSFAFSALDGKKFNIEDTKKLMKQILKIK